MEERAIEKEIRILLTKEEWELLENYAEYMQGEFDKGMNENENKFFRLTATDVINAEAHQMAKWVKERKEKFIREKEGDAGGNSKD